MIESENPIDRCSALNSLIAPVASCSRLDSAPARHTLVPSDTSEDRTLSTAADGSNTSSALPGAVNHASPRAVDDRARTFIVERDGPGTMILSDQWQHA